MQSRIAKILLVVFFVALLATPVVLKRFSGATTKGQADGQAALGRYGFRLEPPPSA